MLRLRNCSLVISSEYVRVKVELHCHTAPRSGCAECSADSLLDAYAMAGYHAVYLTDHDEVWPDDELDDLRSRHPGILIYPGIERSVGSEGYQHLLLLGTNNPEYLAIIDEVEILKKAREEDVLSILAHPFIAHDTYTMLQKGLFPDTLEGRTGGHDVDQSAMSERIARKFKLKIINSGDAHSVEHVGRFWIETSVQLFRAADIRGVVLGGHYQNYGQG